MTQTEEKADQLGPYEYMQIELEVRRCLTVAAFVGWWYSEDGINKRRQGLGKHGSKMSDDLKAHYGIRSSDLKEWQKAAQMIRAKMHSLLLSKLKIDSSSDAFIAAGQDEYRRLEKYLERGDQHRSIWQINCCTYINEEQSIKSVLHALLHDTLELECHNPHVALLWQLSHSVDLHFCTPNDLPNLLEHGAVAPTHSKYASKDSTKRCWSVPAYTDLRPFFPYISDATILKGVDSLFEGPLFCLDTTSQPTALLLVPKWPEPCLCHTCRMQERLELLQQRVTAALAESAACSRSTRDIPWM